MLIHSFINVVVLIFLVVFALNYQTRWNNEVAHSRFSLTSYLFDETEKMFDSPRHRVETIDEFLSVLDKITSNYYSLPATSSGTFIHYLEDTDASSVEDMMHRRHPNLRVRAPRLSLTLHNGTEDSEEYATLTRDVFLLKPSNRRGPFQNPDAQLTSRHSCVPTEDVDKAFFIPCRASSIGELFARLVHVHIKFSLYSFERGDEGESVPVSWNVHVSFDLTGHSSVMDMISAVEYTAASHPHRVPILIASALLVTACFDAFLRIKDVCSNSSSSISASNSASSFRPPTSRRPCERAGHVGTDPAVSHSRIDLAATGDTATTATTTASVVLPDSTLLTAQEGGWQWLGFVTNALTISFACATLHRQLLCSTTFLAREQRVTLILGFATMSSCFMLVAMLKFFPAHYVLIDALLTAGRHLALYALGIIPPLVGYAMLGTALFGGFGSFFSQVPTSIVTLICSTFGDNLMDTFTSVDQSEYWLQVWCARLFFFTFLLLFICNVLNVAHSIIQESYSVAVSSFAARREKLSAVAEEEEEERVMGLGGDARRNAACGNARGRLTSQEIEEMLSQLQSGNMTACEQPVS